MKKAEAIRLFCEIEKEQNDNFNQINENNDLDESIILTAVLLMISSFHNITSDFNIVFVLLNVASLIALSYLIFYKKNKNKNKSEKSLTFFRKKKLMLFNEIMKSADIANYSGFEFENSSLFHSLNAYTKETREKPFFYFVDELNNKKISKF